MANKGFVAIYGNWQEKCKIKRAYIIYTKMQHKKSNKIKKKMLTRGTGYVIILLSQGKKTKIEIESGIEIKMDY